MTVHSNVRVNGEIGLYENLSLAKVGYHIGIKIEDGPTYFSPHTEFVDGLSCCDTKILHHYNYVEREIFQSDNTGSYTGQSLTYGFVGTGDWITQSAYLQTDDIAATEPVRWEIFNGTDDTGTLIFDQTYPASGFPASTEINITT